MVRSAGVYIYPTGCLRDFYSHTCLTHILVFPLTGDILNCLGFCSCACWLESRPMMKSRDCSRNNPGVLVTTAPGGVNPDWIPRSVLSAASRLCLGLSLSGAARGAEHELCSGGRWVFPSKTGKWCPAWDNVGDCSVGKQLPTVCPRSVGSLDEPREGK